MKHQHLLTLVAFVVLIMFVATFYYPSGVQQAAADVATSCLGSGSSGSPHQFAMNETATGAFQCSEVPWVSLQNYPSGCSANNFISALSDTPTCSALASVAWSLLTGFPAGCSAGSFVTAVGAALTCAAVLQEAAANCAGSGSSAAPHQFGMNETSAGAWQCSEVPWVSLKSYPSGCSSNNFISALADSPTCSGLASVAWSLLTSFPAGCSAGNFVTAVGATLTCAADNAAEVASNCAAGPPHQYARNETAGGVLQCALLSWASLTAFPSGCSAGNFVTAVGLSLTCAAPDPASSPSACAAKNWVTRVTEDAAGALALTCAQPAFSDLSGTDQPTWANIQSFPSNCAAGNYVYGVGTTLTCATPVNSAFVSNSGSCTISSATANLGAFTTAPTYTTQATPYLHTLLVTLNFEIDPPAAANINTQYTFSYGTGSAPACAASNSGTSVGNTYTLVDVGETGAGSYPGKWPLSVTVLITGLSASTTYWFDLKVTDSSSASWVYLKPQITVRET